LAVEGIGLLLVAAISAALARKRPIVLTLALAVCVGAIGFSMAHWRTVRISAPVVQKKTGPVSLTGQVEKITLMAKGGSRLVLSNPSISGFAEIDKPAKGRITVRSAGDAVAPRGECQSTCHFDATAGAGSTGCL
jgi:competence protein ComEC